MAKNEYFTATTKQLVDAIKRGNAKAKSELQRRARGGSKVAKTALSKLKAPAKATAKPKSAAKPKTAKMPKGQIIELHHTTKGYVIGISRFGKGFAVSAFWGPLDADGYLPDYAGVKGRSKSWTFKTGEEAKNFFVDKVHEKLNKGYRVP